VCTLDDFCCTDSWDAQCVSEATDCGAACDGGVGSSCCTADVGVGCDDPVVENCVCSFDDYCCTSLWDDICVSEAIDCGAAC
jgi:hypothetical protein